jgi:hypothetical protein
MHHADRRRIPGSDAVEIGGQVPPMRTGEGVELLFARAKVMPIRPPPLPTGSSAIRCGLSGK